MFVNANIALTMTHIEDCAEGYRAGWLGSVNVKGCLAGAMLSFLPRDTGGSACYCQSNMPVHTFHPVTIVTDNAVMGQAQL